MRASATRQKFVKREASGTGNEMHFTFHASREARSTSIGCRVTLEAPEEAAFLLQVGRYRDCRIEGVVENHSVLNWLDPLGRPLQRVSQVPPVSSRLFDERTAKMSIAQEKRTGVEERVQQGPVESVDDGSDCADHAHCGLLPWPATELARPVPVRG